MKGTEGDIDQKLIQEEGKWVAKEGQTDTKKHKQILTITRLKIIGTEG